jgi:hypothetical protein
MAGVTSLCSRLDVLGKFVLCGLPGTEYVATYALWRDDVATNRLVCHALHVGITCMSMRRVLCTQDKHMAWHGVCWQIIFSASLDHLLC